jgi:tetratricopeptide (TPR) repeat protein
MKNTKAITKLLIVAVILTSAVACGKSREVRAAAAVERSKTPAKLPPNVEKAWKNRHDKNDLIAALSGLEQFDADNPQYTDVKLSICRGYYLLADGHLYLELNETNEESIKSQQAEYYDKAIQACEAALQLNPALRAEVEKKVPIEKALDKLTVEDIDALYWRYANLGKWSRLQGMTTLLSNRPKFSAMIKKVEELETQMGKKYFFDATLRYQAVGNALSPTGDKKKADEQFQLAIKNNPNYFAVRVLYAEARLKGNEDEFKKQLDYVIKGNPKSLPEIESEQIVEQRKAKKLLDEL